MVDPRGELSLFSGSLFVDVLMLTPVSELATSSSRRKNPSLLLYNSQVKSC